MVVAKLHRNNTIKQSNRLIMARYKLTLYEQRMIIAICSQLHSIDDFEPVRVRVADMADFCNFKGKDAYNRVHNTLLRLMRRTLQIMKPDGTYYVTHWLQTADYIDGGGIIEYGVDKLLIPDFINLKEAYFSTSAQKMMELKGDYSARLYFMIGKMVKVGEFDLSLNQIKESFELGKTYDIITNIKKRVIEPSLAEINDKTDLNVTWNYVKEGRKITKLHIKVEKKDAKTAELPSDKQDLYDKLIGERWGVSPAKAAALLKYSRVRLERNIRYAYDNRKGKEANMGGWLVSCIEADHAGQQAEAQDAAAKRADEKHQAEIRAAAEAIRAENTELGQNLFEEPEPDAADTGHIEKLHALYAKLGKA